MKALFHELLAQAKGMPFAIRYPDGSTERYGGDGAPRFTVVFKNEAVMRSLLINLDLGFGEGYMYGHIDVEGSLLDMLTMILTTDVAATLRQRATEPMRFLRHLPTHAKIAWQYIAQPHSYEKDKHYISAPYDLGNDFYREWLDQSMQYSCGYFQTPDDTIDQAQEQKRDHICRKLRLKPGETLLDIGCGWGGLIIWAAEHYGISGLGVTLSKEQAAECNARIRAKGLEGRIHVEHAHYLDLEQRPTVYDKVVSVGCLEHVGKKFDDRFFAILKKCVKPTGTIVLHTIGKTKPSYEFAFGNKYIFPGVYTLSLAEIATCIQKLDMRVHDVENLRIHYSHTTRRWAADFERHAEEYRQKYGEPFVRMFRLYLTNGIAWMLHGDNELYQLIITPGIDNARPLTRDYLYREGLPGSAVRVDAKADGKAATAPAKPNGTPTRAPARAASGRANRVKRGR